MRTLPLLFAITAISACTSLDEIRQSEPIRSGAFGAGYKDMAACIVYETARRYTVSSAVFESGGRAVLTYTSEVSGPIGTMRNPVWEMTIHQDGSPTRSRAEFRSMKTVIGTTPWADDVWPVVETCAQTLTAHLSPPVQR
ncbi:hypothetical protein [Shumkonia mesophila]|uniref:hypothetical protein n=1 Tax=Shumkonia mesophila TaxID=2838854 RepID=UPI0029341A79|nr:hypothetical protein [Shumkonia mesophila]